MAFPTSAISPNSINSTTSSLMGEMILSLFSTPEQQFNSNELYNNRNSRINRRLFNSGDELITPRRERSRNRNEKVFPKWMSKSNPKNDEKCSICLENLSQNVCGKIKICNHEFHLDCINQWTNSQINNRISMSCPLCRAEIRISKRKAREMDEDE